MNFMARGQWNAESVDGDRQTVKKSQRNDNLSTTDNGATGSDSRCFYKCKVVAKQTKGQRAIFPHPLN